MHSDQCDIQPLESDLREVHRRRSRGRFEVEPLVISCEDCVMRMTSHCADCLVTFLCDDRSEVPGRVALSGEEAVAIGRLSHAGLVPRLRFQADPTEQPTRCAG